MRTPHLGTAKLSVGLPAVACSRSNWRSHLAAVAVGLLTPPFGNSVCTVESTRNGPQVSIESIFGDAMPFIAAEFTMLALVALTCDGPAPARRRAAARVQWCTGAGEVTRQ